MPRMLGRCVQGASLNLQVRLLLGRGEAEGSLIRKLCSRLYKGSSARNRSQLSAFFSFPGGGGGGGGRSDVVARNNASQAG